MNRKKLLFITPVMPSREGRGRNHRAFNWVNKLSETYDVSILCTSIYGYNYFEVDEYLSQLGCKVYSWRHPNSLIRKIINLVLLRPINWNTKGSKWIRELKMSDISEPDVILCFRLQNAQVALHAKSIWEDSELWLDLDELDSHTKKNISRLAYQNGHYREAVKSRVNAFLFHWSEIRMIPLFNKIFASTFIEEELIKEIHGFQRTEIFENKLPSPQYRGDKKPDERAEPYRFLFVGDSHYYPNSDAISLIIEQIAPALKRIALRKFEFVIVTGNLSRKQREKIDSSEYISSYTNVNDLSKIYSRTDAVIVPLRTGGGSSLKLLEALQYSKPVISTPVGARGFNIKHGEQLLIGSTPEVIVHHCMAYLESPQLALKIAQSGNRWFLRNNSYQLNSNTRREYSSSQKIIPQLY